MRKYIIRISDLAETDIDSIIDYIEDEYYAPQTAEKFYNSLIKSIERLEYCAESIRFSTKDDILKYGEDIRRINYKEWAIFYSVFEDIVKIERIIHGSLIVKEI